MNRKEIAILGHVCIDRNKSEKISYVAAGGSATFIARIYSQLNCRARIIAPYGKDFLKYASFRMAVPPRRRSKTLVYENIIKGKGRLQKTSDLKYASPVRITEEVIKTIKRADVIFVTPLLPNFSVSYVRRAIRHAKKGAVKILLPQGYFRNINSKGEVVKRRFIEADKILPLFDFAIVSDEDFPQIEKLAKTWAQKRQIKVVITLGERGALIIESDKKTRVPTVPVALDKIIDSVGLGDIFSAGFAFEYARTKNSVLAVKFGNKLAYINILYPSDKIKTELTKASIP